MIKLQNHILFQSQLYAVTAPTFEFSWWKYSLDFLRDSLDAIPMYERNLILKSTKLSLINLQSYVVQEPQ